MRLVELFKQAKELEWGEDLGTTTADFRTDDGKEYHITFMDEPLRALKYSARHIPSVMETLNQLSEDAKIIRVEFSLQDDMGHGQTDTKYGKTGTGNQYVVFATVIDAMKQFTQKYGYDHIRIVAEEQNRQRLYKRMIKSMPHKNVYINRGDGQEAYIIEL